MKGILADINIGKQVAESLLDFLLRIDQVRRAGRLYVP
jgi:hypothetical protein